MGVSGGPNMIDDGLVLVLDAADRNSLPSAPATNFVLNPTFSGSNDSQTSALPRNWVFSGDSGPNGFRFYTGSIGGVTPLFPDEGMIATLGPNTVPNNRRIYYQGGSQANTTYTLSFYYYMTGSLISGNMIYIIEYSGSTVVKNVYYPLTSASLNTWIRNETTFTTTTSSTGVTNWGPVISYNAATGLFIQRLQVEKSSYANDFISGSRSLTWIDNSGQGYNGALLSASNDSSIPKFNSPNENILNFDGTGSFIDLGLGAKSLIQGQTNFTIGLMFQLDTNDVLRGLMGTLAYGCGRNLGLVSNNGSLTFYNDYGPTVGGTCYSVGFSNYVTPGVWIYAVATYDGTTTTTYGIKNNVLSKTSGTAKSGSTNVFDRSFEIMRGGLYYSKGKVASAFVYNKVLTETEILQNYNAIKSRFNI